MKKLQLRHIAWATSLLFSQPLLAEEREEEILSETVVEAEKIVDEAGVNKYSKEQINAIPGGNGDIQSILIRQSGVEFDNSGLSSTTPGSIDPQKISIHGTKAYDSQVTVDGVSINSNITGGVSYDTVDKDRVDADRYQSMAVDSKLICGLTVYDSNVSASYGKFSGGVVEAEVCAPSKKFGADVSLEYTSSKWLENKNYDRDGVTRLSTSADNHSDFTKWTYRGSFEAKPSNSLGLVGSFSRKTSEIPLMAYSNGYTPIGDTQLKNNKTQIENYYLKMFYSSNENSKWEFSLMNNPVSIDGFNANTKNSGYTSKAGGVLASVVNDFNFGHGFKIRQQISYKENESSRFSDADNLFYWKNLGDKNWGGSASNKYSAEGGYGDIEQKEKTLGYKVDLKLPAVNILNAKHRISVGGALENERYHYSRLTDGYYYNFGTAKSYTGDCVKSDGSVDLACQPGSAAVPGQYAIFRNAWIAGNLEHNSNYKAFYIEDNIDLDRLKIRAGMRWEDYSDANEPVLAPRFMGSYDFLKDRSLKLEFGANRYYAQNLKNYFILSQKRALTGRGSETRKDLDADWVQNAAAWQMLPPPNGLNQPYSDEYAFAISKIYAGIKWQAKYVKRDSKDEVVLKREGSGQSQKYYPANLGETKYDNYSLSMESMDDLEIGKSITKFSFIFDYVKKKSSSNDWNVSNDLFDGDDFKYALYQGELISSNELPVQNFYRPWTLKFLSSTKFENIGINFDAILRVRPGYEKVDVVDEQVIPGVSGKVKVYEKFSLGKSINFDIKISKYWRVRAQENLYAEISIENLFNRSNAYSYSASSDLFLYEKGRQATLRIGYEF